MTEYFAHPELTEESFRFGWFHSGNLGYVDEDHTVFFVDRKKDVIKTGGENIASIEVAHAILSLGEIADCAVVGLPHPRWTEAITAFVQRQPRSEVTEAQVVERCLRQLAPFKVPSGWCSSTSSPARLRGRSRRSTPGRTSDPSTQPTRRRQHRSGNRRRRERVRTDCT